MKRTSTTLLMAAALGGLIAGAGMEPVYGQTATTNVVPGKVAPLKKVPKVHDCAGMNDCKGIGGCKTDANACKFKNACKGRGGCELKAADIKAWEKRQKEKAAQAAPPTPPPVPK